MAAFATQNSSGLAYGGAVRRNEKKQICGMCPAPLSTYNRNPHGLCALCSKRPAHEIQEYLDKKKGEAAANRGVDGRRVTVKIFDKKAWEQKVQKIERIEEARRLLRIIAAVFKIEEDAILNVRARDKLKNARLFRSTLAFVLRKKLALSLEDIVLFLGYAAPTMVGRGLQSMDSLLAVDEKIAAVVADIEKQFDETNA